MKERPILFSTPMVQAILEGRKTQTRRIVDIVNKILVISLRNDGCFIIFTAINEISYGKINYEADSIISQRRLQGWGRWTDLLQNEIQRIWQEGVRGLVSIKRAHKQQGVFNCILESRESQGDKIGSQVGLYGISWDASDYINASKAFGRKPIKQQAEKSSMGDSGGKLAGQEGARPRNERGESSDEQINGQRKASYSLGIHKRIGFAKAYCEDIGDVTIRYKENLRWAVGMTLWVRETFAKTGDNFHDDWPGHGEFYYKADDPYSELEINSPTKGIPKWRHSIFMPREACRILLEVTDVSVERLCDITKPDVIREGIEVPLNSTGIGLYAQLWEKINGEGSWDKNPWVWVITFNRIKQ